MSIPAANGANGGVKTWLLHLLAGGILAAAGALTTKVWNHEGRMASVEARVDFLGKAVTSMESKLDRLLERK